MADDLHHGQELQEVLAHLDPVLLPGRFVYVDLEQPAARSVPDEFLLASLREPEGRSGLLRREHADQLSLEYEFVGSWITLRVGSALGSVGLTAAVSTGLAAAGIPCNVLAGLHHDHLLIPSDRADEALEILNGLG